jgi:hypothetical protein
MRIEYDDGEDILHIKFSNSPIVRDVSQGWNISLGFSATGLAEITVLDAKANGYWPIENVTDLLAGEANDASADADTRGRADHGVFD